MDVIAAISTAPGEAGVAIVRLSGDGSVALADSVFRGRRTLAESPPRFLCYGLVADDSGAVVDEVLAVRFAPRAGYTFEESAEIHCHGGALPSRRCLELLLAKGARLAEPGEFTKRAFLNGRIDLSQAEAVLGVIRAKSGEALAASHRILAGGLSDDIKKLFDDATALSAAVEVSLDFPEEEETAPPHAEDAGALLSRARVLLERCERGAKLRGAVRVALVGRPNVGKSSLMNALLGEARAIVTPVPGTTRDRVEASFVHGGVSFVVTDTAGMRDSQDPIERLGMEQTETAIEQADVCAFVLDSSEPATHEDIEIARAIREKNLIVILNKSDLEAAARCDRLTGELGDARRMWVSALTSEGVESLKDALLGYVLNGSADDAQKKIGESYIASDRILDGLRRCADALASAAALLKAQDELDLSATALREARSALGELLGLDADEALIDQIFSTFCVGK